MEVPHLLASQREHGHGLSAVIAIQSFLEQPLEVCEAVCLLGNRDLTDLVPVAISDQAMIFRPAMRSGELERRRVVGPDVSRRKRDVELLGDKLGYLGMGTVAGEMLHNPTFHGLGKASHRVSPG